jgi:ubiquinone/menaquinone biosynthesis C-methylase UbiE
MGRWFRYFQERIIEALDPRPGQKVLDVGCGTGWAVREIARRIPQLEACGTDISAEMIREANSRRDGLDAVEFVQADSESIPYPDEHFDAVICSSSFHHYPRPVQSLSEIRRVLKRGGSLYLLETSRDGSLLVVAHDLFQRAFRSDHVRYYAAAEIKRFMSVAGFQNIREVLRERGLFKHGKLVTSEILLQGTKA